MTLRINDSSPFVGTHRLLSFLIALNSPIVIRIRSPFSDSDLRLDFSIFMVFVLRVFANVRLLVNFGLVCISLYDQLLR